MLTSKQIQNNCKVTKKSSQKMVPCKLDIGSNSDLMPIKIFKNAFSSNTTLADLNKCIDKKVVLFEVLFSFCCVTLAWWNKATKVL